MLIYLYVYLSVCLSICLSVYLSICLSVCLSANLSPSMSVSSFLAIFQFDIEGHPQVPCPYDYMNIRAGFRNQYGPLCGQKFPPNITSTANYMHIEFVSDASGSYKGFKAHYETHGKL